MSSGRFWEFVFSLWWFDYDIHGVVFFKFNVFRFAELFWAITVFSSPDMKKLHFLKIYFTYQSFLLGLQWNECLASGHCPVSPRTLSLMPPTSLHQRVNFALCPGHWFSSTISIQLLSLSSKNVCFVVILFHSKNFHFVVFFSQFPFLYKEFIFSVVRECSHLLCGAWFQ